MNPILFEFGTNDNSTDVPTTKIPTPSKLKNFGFDVTGTPYVDPGVTDETGIEINTDVVTNIITEVTTISNLKPAIASRTTRTTSSQHVSPPNPTSTRSSNRSTTKRSDKEQKKQEKEKKQQEKQDQKQQKKPDQKDSNKQNCHPTDQPNRNQPKNTNRRNSDENYFY